MQLLTNARKKAVGFKQSLKAIERGAAHTAYLASDAEEKIRRPILEACKENNVPIVEGKSMTELGKASGIQIGTAVAVVLEPGLSEK